MSRSDPQFNLRIPETLRDLVMASAKQNKRSATAEILDRLERSFTEPDMLGVSDLERMDPSSAFFVPNAENRVTTKIHKERLLDSFGDPLTAQEEKIISAMLKALRGLGKFEEEEEPDQPNKGPTPRKRFPKK